MLGARQLPRHLVGSPPIGKEQTLQVAFNAFGTELQTCADCGCRKHLLLMRRVWQALDEWCEKRPKGVLVENVPRRLLQGRGEVLQEAMMLGLSFKAEPFHQLAMDVRNR